MRYLFTSLILTLLFAGNSFAQTGRGVSGQLIDSTKQSLPGSTVKLKTDLGDSTTIATDVDGKFNFTNIKGTKIKLYISSFGYQAVIKNYTFSPDDNKAFVIPPIELKGEARQLKEVTIVGINPIKFKEDTIDYKISAYPVRENAPVEDVLKKMPGVEVDAAGNVTTQGKSVTKIRINGKDFMGGDVQSATKNLPADILESVQVIDDYGDQANLTGVRTGEPNKILNFVIRNDKNYGYSLQSTAGAGRDLLPESPGLENENRYTGSVNFFNFKGNRQITVLGNINNTNTNTFNFGGGGGNRGGGGGGGPRGGGGGGGGGGAGVSNRDGITIARAIGTNYRDQWGQFISVYGSYSYSNNSTFTESSTLRTNGGLGSTNTSRTTATDNPENHRFNFNLEYKPDTVNYLKITPTFSYSGNNGTSVDDVLYSVRSKLERAYTTFNRSNSSAPNLSINALFNHRFAKQGRNFSLFVQGGVSESKSASNPVIDATVGAPNVPLNQIINDNNNNQTFGGTASWLEPIGKISYLELNYSYNYSKTRNNKETNSVRVEGDDRFTTFMPNLSNDYNFTFVTNKVGLNYRVIETNYNYTLGLAVQPSVLEGMSSLAGKPTKREQFNIIPAARYLYNFSRNQSLSINYNGSSQQPS
ncbi:MAG: carboxypeptidase-like regulatory domain-containing protein, partial [Bacteroidota bacterium]